MQLESAARARLAALLARDPVPLDQAALAIAQEEYPQLDPAAYLSRLDALAERVRREAPPPLRAASTLRALREVLHAEEGLRGNDREYSDPRNSFLNEVLDRRLGIPITLSVVYMEVARRAGLKLEGVGLPGHFLVKYRSPSGAEVFVDPFHGGEMFSADECLARFRARAHGRELDPSHLDAVSTRQILGRMLRNLKRLYAEAQDDVRLFWVADRLILVRPGNPQDLRDRGLAAARLGGRGAAERDLEAYLARAPSANDADDVREVLEAVRRPGRLLN